MSQGRTDEDRDRERDDFYIPSRMAPLDTYGGGGGNWDGDDDYAEFWRGGRTRVYPTPRRGTVWERLLRWFRRAL